MTDLSNQQVLITGGSEGIGLALAKRFIHAGSRVLVTGRRLHKLEAAAAGLPGLGFFVSDAGDPVQREALAAHVRRNMPGLTTIINNAGIQRRVALAADDAAWAERQREIDILLAAPVHLNHLLIPHLLAHGKESLIVNVTSGGAYIPQVFAPLYSACKAALHSYTITLRHALANTGCRVVELIPPAVQTAIAGAQSSHGAVLDDFTDAVFAALLAGHNDEIGYGPTESLEPQLSSKPVSLLFEQSAARFQVAQYKP